MTRIRVKCGQHVLPKPEPADRRISSADVAAGRVQPRWHEHEHVETPPGLLVNEMTLREHQARNRMLGWDPLTRDEAQRIGHRPAEIEEMFGPGETGPPPE